MGQRAKFVFVAAGIFICYFYYGILQVSAINSTSQQDYWYVSTKARVYLEVKILF